jgi:hypothetical protein
MSENNVLADIMVEDFINVNCDVAVTQKATDYSVNSITEQKG